MDKSATRRAESAGLMFFAGAMFLAERLLAETGVALEQKTVSLGLSRSQQSSHESLKFVGGLVVGLLLWRAQARVPMKFAVGIALLFVVFSALPLLIPTYVEALVIAGLRGIAVGAIVPLSSAFVASQRALKPGVVATSVNTALRAGLVMMAGGAFLLSSLISVGWQTYPALAVPLAIILLLFLVRVSLPPVSSSVRPRGTHWLTAASGPLGGEGYALMLMADILAGRLGATILIQRTGSARVLIISAVSISIFGTLWSVLPDLAPAWLLMMGLSTANLFPGLITHVAENRPDASAATVTAASWTGGLGGLTLPFLAGVVTQDGLPDRAATLFIVVPVAGAVLSLGLVRRSA